MSFITIATAPKPFTNPHIATIQWNAIQSWVKLGEDVDVVLIGDEIGMAETAVEVGVQHRKDVARNASGTPLVSSIFRLMRSQNENPILLYVNADIVLMPELIPAVRSLRDQSRTFLGVGQRWDLDIQAKMDFVDGWSRRLTEDCQKRGRIHAPVGSDYFIFPRTIFVKIPDFAIGRAGWDNWMIFEARRRRWKVVDMTPSVNVIHQEHDYSHLPGGQPHYRLPETAENTRLAGGRRAIFTLPDADFRLIDNLVHPIPLAGRKLLREIEIFPLVRLRSYFLGEFFFIIFHPVKAWREWSARVKYILSRLFGKG